LTKPPCKPCKKINKRKGIDPPCDDCNVPLMPENLESVEVFLTCQNQLLMAPGGVIGMNHMAIYGAMDLYGVKDRLGCMEKVLLLEQEVLLPQHRTGADKQ